MLTEQMIREDLARRCGYLRRGPHAPFPGCSASARELRSALLGRPWTRTPENSSTDEAANVLNDAPWTSATARTEGCIPLVLLAEADAVQGWVQKYVDATIRLILPLALHEAARARPIGRVSASLRAAANLCAQEGASDAASFAAYAVRIAQIHPVSSEYNGADFARHADNTISAAGEAAEAAARAAEAIHLGALRTAAEGAACVAAATAAISVVAANDILNYAVAVLLACHRGHDPMLLKVPYV